MKIGVLCPADIAHRRFLPALKAGGAFDFAGVCVASAEERVGSREEVYNAIKRSQEKAAAIAETFGGTIYSGYESLLADKSVEAVYIPLPPALHFQWAKRALKAGKHVLVEKPATTCLQDAKALVELAAERDLALHENYMFAFHSQIAEIENILKSGEIGDIRLYRIAFGFPRRDAHDFRYNDQLGGGALLDAGGYTLKLAGMMLGCNPRVRCARLNHLSDFPVDIYGAGTLINDRGDTAQITFGMDNDYKCELEVWGSKGTLYTGRVLTAPVGFEPTVLIKKNGMQQQLVLASDDAFQNSIMCFKNRINNSQMRMAGYQEILDQAELVDQFLTVEKDMRIDL